MWHKILDLSTVHQQVVSIHSYSDVKIRRSSNPHRDHTVCLLMCVCVSALEDLLHWHSSPCEEPIGIISTCSDRRHWTEPPCVSREQQGGGHWPAAGLTDDQVTASDLNVFRLIRLTLSSSRLSGSSFLLILLFVNNSWRPSWLRMTWFVTFTSFCTDYLLVLYYLFFIIWSFSSSFRNLKHLTWYTCHILFRFFVYDICCFRCLILS